MEPVSCEGVVVGPTPSAMSVEPLIAKTAPESTMRYVSFVATAAEKFRVGMMSVVVLRAMVRRSPAAAPVRISIVKSRYWLVVRPELLTTWFVEPASAAVEPRTTEKPSSPSLPAPST